VNKFLIPVLVLLGVFCLGLTACPGIGYVVGTGPTVNQSYDLKDFKNIEISNAFGFEISRSDSYSVTISAHENLFDHLDIKKSGETLIVRMQPGSYTNSETRATISLPELSALSVSGASRGSAMGFKSSAVLAIALSGASQLDLNLEAGRTRLEASGASKVTGTLTAQETLIDISGASKLTGSLTAQNTDLKLSGASQCELSGSSPINKIGVSGASHFSAPDFKMQDCSINVSGASNARILAAGTLNIEASGASTLKYSGEPRINGLNVTGASQVGRE
jgi:hypothetical protein